MHLLFAVAATVAAATTAAAAAAVAAAVVMHFFAVWMLQVTSLTSTSTFFSRFIWRIVARYFSADIRKGRKFM